MMFTCIFSDSASDSYDKCSDRKWLLQRISNVYCDQHVFIIIAMVMKICINVSVATIKYSQVHVQHALSILQRSML